MYCDSHCDFHLQYVHTALMYSICKYTKHASVLPFHLIYQKFLSFNIVYSTIFNMHAVINKNRLFSARVQLSVFFIIRMGSGAN